MQLPNYVPNDLPLVVVLGSFFVALGIVTTTFHVFFLPRQAPPTFTRSDRLVTTWFLICGCIHMVLEGYFVVGASWIPHCSSLLSQIWKEYAKSDSRYMVKDSTVWGIEMITAFLEGPACFWTVYALLRSKPYRHVLQLLISVGQLYGVVLYYLTAIMDGDIYSDSRAYYYWGYFVLMNLPWVVVPSILIVSSVRAIVAAFESAASTKSKPKKK